MQHGALLRTLGISPALLAARGLRLCAEAKDLEVVEKDDDGKEHSLTPEAAVAWRRMKGAAHQAGVLLFIVSAYRSIDRQVQIIRRKLDAGQQIEDILCVSAPPGFSEHHTGRAVDLSTPGAPPLEPSFDKTAAFRWLQQHAERFGFRLSYPRNNPYGYQYEPWHWCYVSSR